jgi:hypothetical protein
MITAKFTLSHVRDSHTNHTASLHHLTAHHPHVPCLAASMYCAVLPNSCFNEDGGIYSQVKLSSCPQNLWTSSAFFKRSGNYICFLWGS